jgi:hypothetical protein
MTTFWEVSGVETFRGFAVISVPYLPRIKSLPYEFVSVSADGAKDVAGCFTNRKNKL